MDFPLATVGRILKDEVPDANFSKDAKATIALAAPIFVAYLSHR
jgi:histone H3/H4